MTEKARWTIAYRRPTATRFNLVTDWSGNWEAASTLALRVTDRNPLLQVKVCDVNCAEILVHSNPEKWVRVETTGRLGHIMPLGPVETDEAHIAHKAVRLLDGTQTDCCRRCLNTMKITCEDEECACHVPGSKSDTPIGDAAETATMTSDRWHTDSHLPVYSFDYDGADGDE